ncbi:MAG: hypothetical protein KBA81_03245 [Rhabdochlamydiaceae bacterium]|nr:hypothetical protein [Rhabdochlamydiaceae bacterium]
MSSTVFQAITAAETLELRQWFQLQGVQAAAAVGLPIAKAAQEVIGGNISPHTASFIGKIVHASVAYAAPKAMSYFKQWISPKIDSRTQEDLSQQIQHRRVEIESSFKRLNMGFEKKLQNEGALLENAQISIEHKLEESRKLQKALNEIPEENLAFVLEDLEKELVDIFTNNEGRFDVFMADLQKQEEIEKTRAEAMASLKNSKQEHEAVTLEIADLLERIAELSFE